jgi:hypothetical protein
MHTEKRLLAGGTRGIVARVENVFSRPYLTLYDPLLIKDFLVTSNHHYEKSKLGERLTNIVFGQGYIIDFI